MDEAEYCDRIGLVYRGKLIASGTPDDLKAQSANDEQPDPTMEQAFIQLIHDWDKEHSNEYPILSWRRVRALCVKETRQIVRDPSSWLIAVVIPLLLLFIFWIRH